MVVQHARTGELLAVASYPTFDPNTPGQSQDNWTNKAFNEVYEPGSTAKVMTAAAALEEGVVTPSTVVEVPNRIWRADGREFRDSHDHPTEYLTFAGVLAQSSNIGTVLAGEKIKPAKIHDYFYRFGLGQSSGMRFPGEGTGILKQAKDWDGSQRFTVLYGQGLSVNALQATAVFQTIANNGVRVPPRLISAVGDGKGGFVDADKATPVRVISPDVAKQVRDMMEGVVGKDGTAPEAKIDGYRVAGKTGTADRYDARVGGYSGKTASFIGFAPADKPELVVSVTLQRPIKGYFGGVVAGPVFRDVMTYALQSSRSRRPTRRRRRSRSRPTPSRRQATPPCCATPSPTTSGADEAGSLVQRVIPRPRPHATPLSAVAAAGAATPGAVASATEVTGVCLDSRAVQHGDLYAALPGAHAHGAAYAAGARRARSRRGPHGPGGGGAARRPGRPGPTARRRRPARRPRRGVVARLRHGRPRAPPDRGDRHQRQDHHGPPGALRAGRPRPHDGSHRHGRDPHRRRAGQERSDHPGDDGPARAAGGHGGAGVDSCVMEVSSHALELHRVDGVVYDVALFTNLSQDHLDFHPGMREYFLAKASLFTPERSRRGIVCVDDEWGQELVGLASVPVTSVSSRPEVPADWRLVADRSDPMDFTLSDGTTTLSLHSALPGDFNRVNTALAALALLSTGVPAGQVELACAADPHVPGRMEPVTVDSGEGLPRVVVDYAHTPEAVASALRALRSTTRGRWSSSWARGDRDRGKRGPMGRAAAEHADIVFVTDDNPRSEDPGAIRAALLEGARSAGTAWRCTTSTAVPRRSRRRSQRPTKPGRAAPWPSSARGTRPARRSLAPSTRSTTVRKCARPCSSSSEPTRWVHDPADPEGDRVTHRRPAPRRGRRRR